MHLADRLGRPLADLRLSVTDRCNLRCSYCMPEEEYRWLPRADILRFEELVVLVQAFVDCGVEDVRLTGGEPLLRQDIVRLVGMLRGVRGLRELSMTTNGILYAPLARELRDAGLDRVTISLDTLDPARFLALSRRAGLDQVLASLEAAREAGMRGTKIDTVLLRGVNDAEILALFEHARSVEAEIRYIEYMDVGGATQWSLDKVVPAAEVLATIQAAHGPAQRVDLDSRAPARRFLLADGTVFGLVASTTQPFCGTCDRSRVTADGLWFHCLYATSGTNLRELVRADDARPSLVAAIRRGWSAREDRGAQARFDSASRGTLAAREVLRDNPHLEMHTRGG
jgi:cyclic pyranopterin phosphate synthase